MTYLDLEVGVEQELELEALLALVADCDDRLQAVLAQCDAVHEPKVQWPCLSRLLAEGLTIETEIELDRVGVEGILSSRLAQELPA
jgi:hypothetical protein